MHISGFICPLLKNSTTWCVIVFMNPQTSIEIWLQYMSKLYTRKFNMNVSSCTKPRKSNLTFLFYCSLRIHTQQIRTVNTYVSRLSNPTLIHVFNPLNPELNPICYLLAFLAHHFLHVSRIRVKSLTLRLLMSYIYGAPILDVSRSYTTTHHSR